MPVDVAPTDDALALALADALTDGDTLALADPLVEGDVLALTLDVALLPADALTVGVELLVGVAPLETVAAGDAVVVAHTGRVMVLSSSVTAPLPPPWARTPRSAAPSWRRRPLPRTREQRLQAMKYGSE